MKRNTYINQIINSPLIITTIISHYDKEHVLYHQWGLASKFLSLLPSTLWTVKGHPSWLLHLLLTYGARLNRWTLQGLSWGQAGLSSNCQGIHHQESPEVGSPILWGSNRHFQSSMHWKKLQFLLEAPRIELLDLHHGPWIGKLPQSAQQSHRSQSYHVQVHLSGHHHRVLQESQHLAEKQAGGGGCPG